MPKLRSEAHIIGTGKRQNDQKEGFWPGSPRFYRKLYLDYLLSARARSRWLQGSAFPSPCFLTQSPVTACA